MDTAKGVALEVSGVKSKRFDKAQVVKRGHKLSKDGQSRVVNGLEEYKSSHMFYSNTYVSGRLMKRIENKKFYHTSAFHEKQVDLQFSNETISISDKKRKVQYRISDLLSVEQL